MEFHRFSDRLSARPEPSGLDIVTRLQHFAIVTYTLPPDRLRPLIHERFELDTIRIGEKTCALISVVPFLDVDFTSAVFPFPKFSMGQTNYRVYVTDRETGESVVWFIGTMLASWTNFVPRFIWKLPWHGGKLRFDCELDPESQLYHRYAMQTTSQWAGAELHLEQKPEKLESLGGYPELENGLAHLTHPLTGYFYRRDGTLGTYRIWHERMDVKPAHLLKARFDLLDRLNLVSFSDQQKPHSVLVLPEIEFTVYLPPKKVKV